MIRKILATLGSVLIVVAVVGVTILLVSYGRGYTYDFSRGRMIQTGLVLIRSNPAGAQITVGTKVLRQKSPYRGSYEAGTYTFELNKSGFRVWRKALEVVASQVTSVEYIVMLPVEIAKTILDTQPQILSQAISRDHRHLVYVTGGADPAVYTLDLGSKKVVKVYTPALATPTTAQETVISATWSDDASHILVVSNIGVTLTHRVMSSTGSEIMNLTDKYRFNFAGLQFSGTSWQQLYWISPDGLRRVDLGNQTVSAVLADKVSQFNIAGDRILYVQLTDLGRTLWSTDSRGRNQELIPALPESDNYSIALSNYRNEDQLAVVPSKTGVATLYTGIFGSTPVAKTVARGVTTANFSPDGHLVVFSSTASIQTYDLEASARAGKPIVYTFPADSRTITDVSWFDNFHLLLNYYGALVFADFDGTNLNDIGSMVVGQPAYGSSDFKSVFSLSASGNSTQITESTIRP